MQPYFAYLPQVKWFQFTMQRSTRCVSSIADWTSVPPHKQRHFRRPASSSPVASIVFIHLDAEGGRGGRRRRDTETKHSPSNSAGPTPTMMMERGSVEPWTRGGKKIRRTNAQIVQTGLFVCLFSHKPSGRSKNQWTRDWKKNYLTFVDISYNFFPSQKHKERTIDKPAAFKTVRGGEKRQDRTGGGTGEWHREIRRLEVLVMLDQERGNHPNCKFVPGTFWNVCVSLQILIYKDLRICFSPVLVHTQLLKMVKEAPPDH